MSKSLRPSMGHLFPLPLLVAPWLGAHIWNNKSIFLETMKKKSKWHSVKEMVQVLLESWAHVPVLFLSSGVGTFCHWALWDLMLSMVWNPYPKFLGLLSHQPHQQITWRFSPLATRAAFEISFCGYVSVARHDAAHLAILPLNRLR